MQLPDSPTSDGGGCRGRVGAAGCTADCWQVVVERGKGRDWKGAALRSNDGST